MSRDGVDGMLANSCRGTGLMAYFEPCHCPPDFMPSSPSPDITKKCHLSLTGLALAGDPFLNRVSAGRLSFPPPLLGQIGKVLCTNITHELTHHILVGVMRRKSAFLLNAP